MRYQRDARVVAALCPILLFMEHRDDGIFPQWHLDPPPNTNDDIEQSLAQGGITVEGNLEQLNGDSVRSDAEIETRKEQNWGYFLSLCRR